MQSKRILKGVGRRVIGFKNRTHRTSSAARVDSVPAQYSIDSPLKSVLDNKNVVIEGWLIPNTGSEVIRMRVINNARIYDLPYGLKRPDVAKAYPKLSKAANCGFSLEVEIEDGQLLIEVDLGSGYKQLHSIVIRYSPEQLVADLFNPDLSQNWAEHQNLINNRKVYEYEPANDSIYNRHAADPRLLAFYLPQYHPIEQNDYVWGKGFTEWTNVTADTPRFIGHQQPILPADFGFYDLRYEDSIKEQITLAKKHGIYGFCFYYYWFSGERLLQRPLDSFLKHTEWDFNFTICWANENWTKRWDGRDNEVIIAQRYLDADPLKFITDVTPILLDPRYIKQDGKPVLVVFRASELKQPALYAKIWRDYFMTNYNLELHLVSCMSFEDTDPRSYGFDAALDFAPQSAFFKNDCFPDAKYPYVDITGTLLDINFEGSVANYRTIALNKRAANFFDFPIHMCVTPAWDNDARKKGKGFVMKYSSPDVYGAWLNNILETESKKTKAPLIFLNAWNEWAEGAILEPTSHQGHAVLNRTSEVLSAYSHNKGNRTQFRPYGMIRSPNAKLAVVIHMFYPEFSTYLAKKLQLITEPYDLYLTINEKDRPLIPELTKIGTHTTVLVVPNRGRDVLPFLFIAQRLRSLGYEQVLKLHTKRSSHREDGQQWFEELVDNLLPNESRIKVNLQLMRSGKAPMVGPKGHLVSLKRHMGSNEEKLQYVLSSMFGAKVATKTLKHRDKYGYFGGTMFWVSLTVLAPLLDLYLLPDDFDSEKGQIDGSLAHALERVFGLLPQLSNCAMYESSLQSTEVVAILDPDKKYEYAP
jgi:lipopolysaccharide biosynthesis protein